MSDRQIKYVELAGNTVFRPAATGAYGDQRTTFGAGESCKLSLDETGAGVFVQLEPRGGSPAQWFTIAWTNIKHIEWVVPEQRRAKAPEKAAEKPAA